MLLIIGRSAKIYAFLFLSPIQGVAGGDGDASGIRIYGELFSMHECVASAAIGFHTAIIRFPVCMKMMLHQLGGIYERT